MRFHSTYEELKLDITVKMLYSIDSFHSTYEELKL